MIKFKKIKISEPKHITDEKEIWYCNHAKCKEHCHEQECLLYRIERIIDPGKVGE